MPEKSETAVLEEFVRVLADAWESGSPVAGQNVEVHRSIARIAIRRIASFSRRDIPSHDRALQVRDLARGLVDRLESEPDLVGPLIEDYRYVARLLLNVCDRVDSELRSPPAEFVTQYQELNRRVREGMRRLPPRLQDWLKSHLAQPEKIVAHSDPESESPVSLVKVTTSTGTNDSSYMVVFDEARSSFGLVTRLDGERLWYLGEYGELEDAVSSM